MHEAPNKVYREYSDLTALIMFNFQLSILNCLRIFAIEYKLITDCFEQEKETVTRTRRSGNTGYGRRRKIFDTQKNRTVFLFIIYSQK